MIEFEDIVSRTGLILGAGAVLAVIGALLYYIITLIINLIHTSENYGNKVSSPSFSDRKFRLQECKKGYVNNSSACFNFMNPVASSGRLADCEPGYENNGKLCYSSSSGFYKSDYAMTCNSGEDKVGPKCYKSCADGYTRSNKYCVPYPTIPFIPCKENEEAIMGKCYEPCPYGAKSDSNGRCIFK